MAQKKIRIDANIIGSILLGGKTRDKFIELVLNRDKVEFFYSEELLIEVRDLSEIMYFKSKGITLQIVEEFIRYFQGFAIKIIVTSAVKIKRDKKDNYLLSLFEMDKLII